METLDQVLVAIFGCTLLVAVCLGLAIESRDNDSDDNEII